MIDVRDVTKFYRKGRQRVEVLKRQISRRSRERWSH